MKACTVAAAALRWLMVRGVLARPCTPKVCVVVAAALCWLVSRSANRPSTRNARAERVITRLHEGAEEGRENALEDAIEAEGRADPEDHDADLDRGDDVARPYALKAGTVIAGALKLQRE